MIFNKLWGRNGHRSEADIVADIYRAFRRHDPLHGTNPRIQVEVSDGVATLRGVVRGGGQRGMAAKLAAEVEGVESVRNELLDDPTLKGTIAHALAVHPQLGLSTRVVWIRSYNGVVTLGGPVSSQAQQMTAEAAIRSVPGVVDVVNRLVVSSDL